MEVECACGCGEKFEEKSKWGRKRKFIHGHNSMGRKASEESKRKNSESHKRGDLSDETRRKLSEANKRRKYSEETLKKMSESHKGRKKSDETRKKMSESSKRENLSDETIRKMSDAQKGEKNHNFGKKPSDETRRKNSDANKGEKSHAWLGGISFGEYCHKFNETYKEKIREYYGRKCFLCDKSEEDNDMKLPVHHVDYNKECGCDDSMCKCVPLCNSCHSKTNHNRKYWEAKITLMLKPDLTWCEIFGLRPLTDFFIKVDNDKTNVESLTETKLNVVE